VLLIPIYLTIAHLGLTNTLSGLVIAYVTFMLPFALWLMRSFLAALPVELEAAALIDGASRWAVFWDIVLPQAVPGLVTTAVFSFILAWNEYLYALVVISRDARKTLPPGVMTTLVTGYNVEWGMVMAASVMMSFPLLAIFLVLQRHLVRGFGAGALKG
jgi:multiple sugar transport system permease protein